MTAVNLVNPVGKTEPIAPHLVRRKINELLENGLSPLQLAKEVDISPWYIGMVRDANSEIYPIILEKLSVWLANRKAAAKESEPGFVPTPTALAILSALEEARNRPGIAVIYGGSGVGKTLAVERYYEEVLTGGFPSEHRGSNVIVIEANAGIHSPPQVLAAVADALNCERGTYGTPQLINAISRHIEPGDLIVIDEAQWLVKQRALDTLRCFLDRHKVGIAYLGNDVIYTTLSQVGRGAQFAQLSSRVVARLPVPNPTAEDVDVILDAWNVHGRKERAFCQEIGTMDGGLRLLTNVIRKARDLGGTDVVLLKSASSSIGLKIIN